VPAAYCDVVPSCDLCADGQGCVAKQAWLTSFECIELPPTCDDTLTCGCAEDLVCDQGWGCFDGGSSADISCECLAC
jgi:hypothetical protein